MNFKSKIILEEDKNKKLKTKKKFSFYKKSELKKLILLSFTILIITISFTASLENINSKITIDKTEIFVGEKINIKINKVFKDSRIIINCTNNDKTESYKIFSLKSSLSFTPEKSGECTIFLIFNNNIEDFKSFIVLEKNENDTEIKNLIKNLEESSEEKNEIFDTNYKETHYNENSNFLDTAQKNKTLKITRSKNKELTKLKITEQKINYKNKKTILEFENLNVKKIEFENLELSENTELKIDDINPKKTGIKGSVKAYAIDPSKLNFTKARLSSIAKGTELWKCKEWDFEKQECFGNWNKIMDLIPNTEYDLEINSEDPAFLETGFATINTKKPIYHPNENVEVLIAVLDIEGYLVTNADVILKIETPNNNTYYYSTTNNEIIEVQKGIYKLEFNKTQEVGTYLIEVRAKNYYFDYTFKSSFLVLTNYSYDIIRETPMSIDPLREKLNTKIRIISYGEDNFNLTEIVPIEFIITNTTSDYQLVDEENNIKKLVWTNIKNNSIVSYTAVLPKKYPRLYELKSIIEDSQGIFEEARIWYLAADPATGRALIVYGINSNNPYYNIWDGTSLSTASTAINVGAQPDWIITASNPNSEEIILATIDTSNDVNVQVWNGTDWHSQLELETGSSVTYKGFDVAYESLSGRALVVYNDGTAIPKYYIWNGSSWLGEYSCQNTGSTVRWIELASDPNSNYIILVTQDGDAASDINVQIWNGTSWSTPLELTTNAFSAYRNFDVEWSINNYAIVVYGTASYEQVRYALYNKTTNSWPITNGLALSVETGGGTDYPY
ncbi:MAG: hypothetical protein QXU20_03365, partial [Candidatus Woesearchaeota archaeon]